MAAGAPSPPLPRNDPRLYDHLVDHWWRPDGRFAALHWLAESRARLIPPAAAHGHDDDHRPLLVDVGCGGGLLAGRVPGYRHVGVDVVGSALHTAAGHGLTPVAGELFEHVTDLEGVVAEVARVLRPGGTVVFDTINDTRLARLTLVAIGERMPGGPPPRIHDPALFVRPDRLARLFARHGVVIECWGLRPSVVGYAAFLRRRQRPVRMVRTRSLAALYQGVGRRAAT